MIDHICLVVRDYARSKAFYTQALAPLGAELVMEFGVYGGFGQNKKPSFWIGGGPPSYWDSSHKPGAAPMHIAFVAKDRATVDAFYAAAMAAGAKDFGPPGVRKEYHPSYYGAFVLDPDGNDVEAVCHLPPA